MGEFFKPWRRKVGIVSLLMALVFMGGWVRSNLSEDEIRLEADPHEFSVVVSERQLLTFRYILDKQATPSPWFAFSHLSWGTSPLSSQSLFDMDFLTWRFRWLEFGFAEIHLGNGGRHLIWFVPYWSVTIPLTLISLWLLLSKPRKSNQNKIGEPVSVKVT